MSAIPTPVGRSRLPAPKSVTKSSSGSNLMAGPSGGIKRGRGLSTDLEEGLAKKSKTTTTTSTFSRPLSTARQISNVKRPLPGSMMSGRATTCGLTSSRATATTKRPISATTNNAMKDRTNTTTTVGRTNPASKKIPPWDTKARLKEMEEVLKATTSRVAILEDQNVELETNVQDKETVVAMNTEELTNLRNEKDSICQKLEAVKKELEEKTEESDQQVKKLKREIDDLEFSKSSLERKCKSLEDELNSKMEEIAGLKTSVSQLTSSSAGMEAELKQTKTMLTSSQEHVSDLTKLSNEQCAKIETYEENARAFETERRKLHNTIQELKGNIRVFCRIRPLLKNENGDLNHIELVDDKSVALVKSADSPNESVASGLKGKASRYDFQFDKVFNPNAGQSEVFEEISQLVQSAIDGYHVCVFAYGQTGSGKTFTMEGGEQEGQEGMIPKTIEKIFEETSRLMEKGWEYKLEANFLEIYNEEIRDLLATEKNLKYDIKLSKDGSSYVTNLKVEDVSSPRQISQLLQRAQKNRAVAATNCNERSSRSHSVFQMKITGTNSITTESCSGMLNLVDLAGSERLKESGSEGVRLVETKSINKSLANLGNVIMALAQKDPHIPYRNSKLTHLLQGSLGGNSKTLMFVNVNPREEYFGETINSLRFATKVNQCQIGTATKKMK